MGIKTVMTVNAIHKAIMAELSPLMKNLEKGRASDINQIVAIAAKHRFSVRISW